MFRGLSILKIYFWPFRIQKVK